MALWALLVTMIEQLECLTDQLASRIGGRLIDDPYAGHALNHSMRENWNILLHVMVLSCRTANNFHCSNACHVSKIVQ